MSTKQFEYEEKIFASKVQAFIEHYGKYRDQDFQEATHALIYSAMRIAQEPFRKQLAELMSLTLFSNVHKSFQPSHLQEVSREG